MGVARQADMSKKELTQFAEEVVNFSSQYGTAGTSSYTASNLAGDLNVYNKYGDYQEAFVLRTYGKWWQCCPSASRKLKKSSRKFRSQDFVELRYGTQVFPTGIDIYETYHPGAVVRILACNTSPTKKTKPGEVEWVTLWSGAPQCSEIPKESRKFSPPIKKTDFPTNLVRLEFNSEECGYYTELDGAALRGTAPQSSWLDKFKDRASGFQVSLTTRLIRQLSLSDRQTSISSEDEEFEKWGYFGMLPDEVIQLIFKYLDVVSLASVAQTCSLLLKNAYDPWIYSELDLQSLWNTVDDVALESLTSRCQSLKHLNLSWTGGGGQITEQALCGFIEECGSELISLNLSCCPYIGKMSLATIGRVCTQLEGLDLQSCLQLKEEAFLHIGELGKLKRLNLYSTELTKNVLETIGRKCPLVEHLNIGACKVAMDRFGLSDPLMKALNTCLQNMKNLVSIDLWRCRFASSDTLHTLADNCPKLEEIDIGWCHAVYRKGFDADYFCSRCPRLKKIYLTCGRTINDGHMKSLANHCRELEQIDILGTNMVTEEGAMALLKACPKLIFFDLSFCANLNDEVVDGFQKMFPRVCFKKSFN